MRKALVALLVAAPLAVLANGAWFHGTVDEGLKAAAQQQKILTLKFYADW